MLIFYFYFSNKGFGSSYFELIQWETKILQVLCQVKDFIKFEKSDKEREIKISGKKQV